MSEQTAESTHNSISSSDFTMVPRGNLEPDVPEEQGAIPPTHESFLVQTLQRLDKKNTTSCLNKFYEACQGLPLS